MGYAEQARLSERHRAAQARLQIIIAADVARVFPLLDVNNLDRSFGNYAEVMTRVINARRRVSASLGATYYTAIRQDAVEDNDFAPVLSDTADPQQVFTSLLVTGPVAIKKAVSSGRDALAARDAALMATAKSAQRHVINGGRGTILGSVRRDNRSVGWARLTDGKPCAFCSLLASRGPAYKSETTAQFKSHDGCGCTPVPVFDFNAPWPGRGQEFRDLYDEEISGKFNAGSRSGQSGQLSGKGANEALKEWRKVYEATL